jgi:hydroxylaminobenzene mutase
MGADSSLRRHLAAAGAALFAAGMFTGLWTAAALTGKVVVRIPHMALVAHLNALLGGLWLIALAATLDLLCYGPTGKRRLAWLSAVPAWSNWAVSLGASFVGVKGLEYTGDHRNDVVAALLQGLVVVPTLVAVVVWVLGFRSPRRG